MRKLLKYTVMIVIPFTIFNWIIWYVETNLYKNPPGEILGVFQIIATFAVSIHIADKFIRLMNAEKRGF